jgi:hypothetical protein
MATYIFEGTFHIGADDEEEAREGLMELLATIVSDDDSNVFDLIETIPDLGGR